MIRTEGLAKSYQGKPVLHGVSLHVPAGRVFGFVGPNGAGKSTFLKCLVGVVAPDAGTIILAGIDARAQPLAARRCIGYAPGETTLYARLRAEELLDFALAYHPHADRARGRELLAVLGVPPARRVGKLSHGMKRKLLLSQALACRAPLLLLDEPMEGLDPEARRLVEELLRAEAAAGRTVFFSSHDLGSVQRLCDEVAFLRHGRLLETGPVSGFLERAGRVLWVQLREPVAASALPAGPELRWTGDGRRWKLEFAGPLERLLPRLQALPIAGLRNTGGSLEEVFEALYGPDPAEAA